MTIVNGHIRAFRMVPRRLSEMQADLLEMLTDAALHLDHGADLAGILANIDGQARAVLAEYDRRRPLGPLVHRIEQPPQWLAAVAAFIGALHRARQRGQL